MRTCTYPRKARRNWGLIQPRVRERTVREDVARTLEEWLLEEN